MMIVYQTDDSGYFMHSVEADPDPMTPGNFLIPRGCVKVAPPKLSDNEAAQWANGNWIVVPDYRGTTYWLADRTKHVILERGVNPPNNSFTVEPPKTLDELKAEKKEQIERERDAERVQNVVALGTTWQADDRSQTLLSSAITLSTAGLPLPTVWRDALNNDVSITSIDQLLAISQAIATQTQQAYQTSWVRKTTLSTAQTPDEVDLV